MKYFLLLIILFLSALVYGQGWNATGYNKEVYLEHENKIWFPKNHSAQHDYKCSNCQIKYFDRGILLTVETKAPHIVIYQINKKTNHVVDSLQLKVREYPTPTVCWNERTSDRKRGVPVCSDNFNSISIHLNCRFDDVFKVDSTNISIGNKSYVSIGNNTIEDVSKAIWTERDTLVKVNICVYARNQRGKKIKVCEDFEIVNPFFIGHYRVENIKAIHRNKSTEFLFDDNNPFSFVGYAQRTVVNTIFTMSKRAAYYGFFMRNQKLTYLTKDHWSADWPILDSYGCDSLNNMGSYLYPPNPELNIDKTNINCILLVEESPINFPLHLAPHSRTRVIFAKKYDDDNSGKMEFVFSFLLEELESPQHGLYLKELPNDIVEIFWSENESAGILPIMRRCKAQNDSIKTTYSSSWRINDCKYLYYFPNQDWFNLVKPKDYSTGHYSDYVHSVFSRIWDLEPFKNFSRNYGEFMKVNGINLFDEFSVFTTGRLTTYKTRSYTSSKPILDENGDKILLYQQAAFYYAYKKDIRAYQIFELNQNKDSLITAKVLITSNHEGHEIPFLLVRLRDLTQFDYLRQHNAIPISKLPWKLELENALSYSKVYDPNNAEDLKELDALFYLDSYDGKPLNMLNVCLGCD